MDTAKGKIAWTRRYFHSGRPNHTAACLDGVSIWPCCGQRSRPRRLCLCSVTAGCIRKSRSVARRHPPCWRRQMSASGGGKHGSASQTNNVGRGEFVMASIRLKPPARRRPGACALSALSAPRIMATGCGQQTKQRDAKTEMIGRLCTEDEEVGASIGVPRTNDGCSAPSTPLGPRLWPQWVLGLRMGPYQ